MKEEALKLSDGQVKFLMNKFNIIDPNKAIDYLIELMILERIDPMNMKLYILKMMEEELRSC